MNVPSGVWVDETGTIVRPPEPAHAPNDQLDRIEQLLERDDLPPRARQMAEATLEIRYEPEAYLGALRDWAANGADSRFVLPPDEVVARSRPMSTEVARAAACFELATYLHRRGQTDRAVTWFREAHRLDPDNWTYKRQDYYPPLELEPRAR